MSRAKPGPGVPIRWSHPLAVGLVRAWAFNAPRGRDSGGWEFYEACYNDHVTRTRNDADTKWADGPGGPAFQSGASGGVPEWTYGHTLSRWGGGMTASSCTFVGRFKKFGSNPNLESTANGGGSSVVGQDGSNARFHLYATSSEFGCIIDAPGVGVGARWVTTVNSDQWYTLGGQYERDTAVGTYGGRWAVAVDGQIRGENNFVLGGSFGGTFADVAPYLWARSSGASDKVIDYLYAWNRPLTPGEHAWLHDDPFDLFTPARAWSFGAVAGGGGSDGVGSAAGAATVSGVGASTAAAASSSAGVATVAGVGASTATAAGAASGVAAASGVGVSAAEAVVSSSGVATAAGVGTSTAAAVGVSAGVAAASGVGASTADATAATTGIAAASGVGASTAAGVGSSAGVAAVAGVGSSAADAVASSAGVATVSGVGSSAADGQGAGSSAGTSTATAVGSSQATAVYTAAGFAAATGVGSGTAVAVWAAAGAATVIGYSPTTADAVTSFSFDF